VPRTTANELRQRVVGVFGESQPRVALQAGAQYFRRYQIERHQPALDRRRANGTGMFEQRIDQIARNIGREAEPPVLVGSREVDQELVAGPPRATALERSAERV